MSHSVYILVGTGKHPADQDKPEEVQYYTGLTQDVWERLHSHNSGKCKATRGRLWALIAYIPGFSFEEAVQLEHWLKRGDTPRKRAVFLRAHEYHRRGYCTCGYLADLSTGKRRLPGSTHGCPFIPYVVHLLQPHCLLCTQPKTVPIGDLLSAGIAYGAKSSHL